MRALLVSTLLVASCTPALVDGRYACSGADPAECPPGYTCAGGRCRAGTGTECRYSFDCSRPCSDAACVNGYCQFTPISELEGQPCDDGVFCNGENLCTGGECAPQGAPCAGCTEASGCPLCGLIDGPCCDGDFCQEGQCIAGTCRTCGDTVDGRCCPTGVCAAGLTCHDDGTLGLRRGSCVACGGPGEPCCVASRSPSLCAPELGCAPAPVPGGFACTRCGHAGEPCCENGCLEGFCLPVEEAGLFCVVTTCGVECPPSSACAPGEVCFPCGEPGGPCCPGEAVCNDGMACSYGGCPVAVMPASG